MLDKIKVEPINLASYDIDDNSLRELLRNAGSAQELAELITLLKHEQIDIGLDLLIKS
jgi:hypothetical protein